MLHKRLIITLLFFISLMTINFLPVHADGINLYDVPEDVGLQLGISTFAAKILCSLIVMMACLLPMLIVAMHNEKASFVLSIFIGSIALCGLTAIGWLEPFILVFCMFGEIIFIAFGAGKIFGGSQ